MLILKTIIYRILRILIVLLVTFSITGSIGSALSISLIDALVASVYYYYFDKYWLVLEPKIQHLYFKVKYRKMD